MRVGWLLLDLISFCYSDARINKIQVSLYKQNSGVCKLEERNRCRKKTNSKCERLCLVSSSREQFTDALPI